MRPRTALLASASAAIGGAGVLVGITVTPASGVTTLTVDTLVDGPANATDCTTPVAGSCSLRDAIAASSSGDVIEFAPGLTGTLALTNGTLTIAHALTVRGPEASALSIDAHNGSRIFTIYAGSGEPVTIESLGLRNGYSGGSGGAIYLYHEGSDLTVRDVVMSGNSAISPGGAIYMRGSGDLTIERSAFVNNTSYSSGGAVAAWVPDLSIADSNFVGNVTGSFGSAVAVIASNSTTIERTMVTGNTGSAIATHSQYATEIVDTTIVGNAGPGVMLRGGSALVLRTTFDGNLGAVKIATPDPVDIVDCTLSNNFRDFGGAAIEFDTAGVLRVANSTIAQNRSDYGSAVSIPAGATVEIISSTISDNTSTSGAVAGIGLDAMGGTARLTLVSSIVSGNHAVGATSADLGASAPLYITATTSLLGAIDPTILVADVGTDLVGVDALLGPLADNGGPARTMALLAGSPAIDHGAAPLPPFPYDQWDQRGAPYQRVSGGRADIGALEVQVAPAPAPVVPAFTG